MPSKKRKDDDNTIGFGDPSERPHGPLAEDDEMNEEKEKTAEENDEDVDEDDTEGHGYHTVDFDADDSENF